MKKIKLILMGSLFLIIISGCEPKPVQLKKTTLLQNKCNQKISFDMPDKPFSYWSKEEINYYMASINEDLQTAKELAKNPEVKIFWHSLIIANMKAEKIGIKLDGEICEIEKIVFEN